jgi:hypothetical protein
VVARLECSLQPDVGDSTSTGMRQEVDIRYVVTSLICQSAARARSGISAEPTRHLMILKSDEFSFVF